MPLKSLVLEVRLALVAVTLAVTPVRTLRLLTDENPPSSFTEKGAVQGEAADIVREMATRAGIPATGAGADADGRTR